MAKISTQVANKRRWDLTDDIEVQAFKPRDSLCVPEQ